MAFDFLFQLRMEKEKIHLEDIQRILLGQAPAAFLIEVIIRTIIVYIVLVAVLRLMGSRMSGQLTITETAIMLMLGAIVSAAVQMPDRGILWGVLSLLLILIFQQTLTRWMFSNKKVEEVTQGIVSVLVKDGVLQLEQMKKDNVSKEQLFAVLRSKKMYNLGKVKRVYLEGCGEFSIYQQQDQPGLGILPQEDQSAAEIFSNDALLKACGNCGAVKKESNSEACSVCGQNEFWLPAVINNE